MRIIIEQSLEWQISQYSVFVNFQKAFDSVGRDVIWRLMNHYGFPTKFITIIQRLYEDATCQVIHDGKLTEPFFVQTGIRQGCLLPPKIFLLVVDWICGRPRQTGRPGPGLHRQHQPSLPQLSKCERKAMLRRRLASKSTPGRRMS